MGIYDRDYIRQRQPSGGFGSAGQGPRAWSMTTWLILICCGVFFADRMMPPATWKLVEIQQVIIDENAGPNIAYVEGVNEKNRIVFQRVIVDTDSGNAIGKSTFERMPPLKRWLHFSTMRGFLEVGYWRLIGFQFLHVNFTHLLFNMLGLFFFGRLVEAHLGSKRFLAFYLLCGIFGALMYLVLNLTGFIAEIWYQAPVSFPGLLFNDTRTPLVGASAGVFGVLMAGAYLRPKGIVYLFFILPLEMWIFAYFLVAVAIFVVITGGNNAGGEAGHLGGALAGAYFIRHPQHLHGFFDFLGRVDPTSHHYNKSRRKKRFTSDIEIDRILKKIHEKGMHSLTEKERKILRESSREDA